MLEFTKWGPLPVIRLISRVGKVVNSTCRSEITPVKPICIYFQAIYFRAKKSLHLWSACQTLVEQQTELPERLEKDEEERKRPKYGGLGSCQFERREWEDVMYTVYCITDGRMGMILTWSLHEQWWTPWLIGLCRTNKFTEWHRCFFTTAYMRLFFLYAKARNVWPNWKQNVNSLSTLALNKHLNSPCGLSKDGCCVVFSEYGPQQERRCSISSQVGSAQFFRGENLWGWGPVAGCCGLRLNDQEEARRKQAEPW